MFTFLCISSFFFFVYSIILLPWLRWARSWPCPQDIMRFTGRFLVRLGTYYRTNNLAVVMQVFQSRHDGNLPPPCVVVSARECACLCVCVLLWASGRLNARVTETYSLSANLQHKAAMYFSTMYQIPPKKTIMASFPLTENWCNYF